MILMEYSTFEFRRITDDTAALCRRLRDLMDSATVGNQCELLGELGEVETLLAGGTEPRLSLAFVGQYNAGKSTLIGALTDREDIPIDADVCTDTVTAYDWRGIRLLDTPGVQAGYADHDEQTCRCIAQADLLLFVTTPELFDDTVGTYFRRLAFDEAKAPEMMLVVNKMSMTPAAPETLRHDIERVTAPLALDDLRTVFVDALAHLEARSETDPEDRAELLREANLGALEKAIDQFVRDHGLRGRLTTPLYALRSIAHRAIALTPTETAQHRALLLALARALRELDHSERRLRDKLNRLLSGVEVDITEAGDTLAETLVGGVTAKRAEEAGKEAEAGVRQCAERLESDAIQALEEEWLELASRLESIAASDLSGAPVPDLPDGPGYGVEVTPEDADDAMPLEVSKQCVSAMEAAGEQLVRLAAGPRALDAAGKLIATSGSPAYKAVKSVGHFLGHKFKPWEAVKWAHWLGKIGEVLKRAGPILIILLGLIEDRRRKELERDLDGKRSEIRAHFRQVAAELAGRFTEWADALLSAAYGAYREYVAEEIHRIRDTGRQDTDRKREFDGIIEEAGRLIREVSPAPPDPVT